MLNSAERSKEPFIRANWIKMRKKSQNLMNLEVFEHLYVNIT